MAAETLSADPAIDRMQQIFERQKAAFVNDGFVSAETRIDRLTRAYRLIAENQQAIIRACNEDFGCRSMHQTLMSDVMSTMEGLHHNIKHVKRWMKDDKRKVGMPMALFGNRAKVISQPKGVVGNISTWNFPFHVSIAPLAGIFAAGNRAMIKVSEVTPASAELIVKLVEDYFDESECAAIDGGPEVGAAFSSLPFDHIIFTGATSIGRKVLQAATENLTPVTLELGGKSPVLVSRAYDIEKAAMRIVRAKSMNMGQVCLSPDYVFVPEESLDTFIQVANDHFSEMFPRFIDNPDYTSVVNRRHRERLQGLLDDANEKGARIITINPAGEETTPETAGNKLPLTLIINPTDDMRVMQEEIFGPILAIKTYLDLDEAIEYVNAHARPLGLYFFSNDSAEQNKILHRTISGGVTLNDCISHVSCEDLPFGGIGHSGMGNYHGKFGFDTFSHQKAVYRQTGIDLMKLGKMLPPYGKECEEQLAKMCKSKL